MDSSMQEAQGGYSVDKCQIATVFITCSSLVVLWIILADLIGFLKLLTYLFQDTDPCCNPPQGYWNITTLAPSSSFNSSSTLSNGTAAAAAAAVPSPSNPEPLSEQPFCFCPGSGMVTGIGGALPEEFLKYAAFSMFAYRSYVCDPDAVLSMALTGKISFTFTLLHFYTCTFFLTNH
jgi:hypothetical protein